jgi:hypothetical protein
MAEWTVKTNDGTQVKIDAATASVSEAGALVLRDSISEVVRLFAAGTWVECERTKQPHHGYGA